MVGEAPGADQGSLALRQGAAHADGARATQAHFSRMQDTAECRCRASHFGGRGIGIAHLFTVALRPSAGAFTFHSVRSGRTLERSATSGPHRRQSRDNEIRQPSGARSRPPKKEGVRWRPSPSAAPVPITDALTRAMTMNTTRHTTCRPGRCARCRRATSSRCPGGGTRRRGRGLRLRRSPRFLCTAIYRSVTELVSDRINYPGGAQTTPVRFVELDQSEWPRPAKRSGATQPC